MQGKEENYVDMKFLEQGAAFKAENKSMLRFRVRVRVSVSPKSRSRVVVSPKYYSSMIKLKR